MRNVGRLSKVDARGDVTFRKMTLIFAENTRGKTTLCDVLRKTGDPNIVQARRTLGQEGEPFVELLWDGAPIIYRNGAWSDTRSVVEIFDSNFVHENVYAGDVINHDHRKNLYRVLVGEAAVNWAYEIERVDSRIRELAASMRSNESLLKMQLPDDASIEDLLAAVPGDGLEERIEQTERRVRAEKRRSTVLMSQALSELEEYAEPSDLEEVLALTLDAMGSDVERRVELHRRTHTKGATTVWLAESVSFIREESCPFCAQDLVSVELVESYRVLFGLEFRSLKERIDNLREAVLSLRGWEMRVRRTVDANNQRLSFWEKVADVPARINLDSIEDELNKVGEILSRLVRAKSELPLRAMEGSELTELRAVIEAINAVVGRYNSSVGQSNAVVREVKSGAGKPEVESSERHLWNLRLEKLRTLPEVVARVAEREKLLQEQQELMARKELLKNQLDSLTQEALDGIGPRINTILARFGAGFRISPVRRQFIGGRPSSAYELLVNDVSVTRTDDGGAAAEPCFRNTLSGGDRSCLALAFFLARLEIDPRLQDKVVVFDDPFGSQDSSRRWATRQSIWRLLHGARQVIVLSHERGFLREFFREYPKGDMKALRLVRVGQRNSTMVEWDPEEEAQPVYHQDRRRLEEFVNDCVGKPIDVARLIRPILEGFLRRHLGRDLKLLDLFRLIEESPDQRSVGQLKENLLEMREINEYARRFMHDNGEPVDPTPAIDGEELTTYGRRLLDLVDPF